MTTYYVSSEIGSDNNAGTSGSAPLATLQDAANLVKPGDTVEVMNGTYTGNAPGGGDVVDITTSGTASAPITFEAAPGQTPVINSSGGWNAINIEASYIVVSGFTVVGDAANLTLSQALAGYSTGNANLDGNGIAVNSPGNGVVPNHITIENNTVDNEPGGGIYAQGADYVQILNNNVYDNAHWSAFGNSGISIGASANSDTNPGVHDVISGNIVFGNAQLVPTTGGNTITDGEGIILDTNTGSGAADPGYVGEFLVENNTVYNNGSSGIESFQSNDAVITGNTSYGNNTENVQAASVAQIFINQSSNNTVTNNTTTAPNGTSPPAAPVIGSDTISTSDAVTLMGTAPDGATVTVSDGTSLGTTTASSAGSWSFTTPNLPAGNYTFTATDTTSAGTSAASSPFGVTVGSSDAPPPAAPVISSDTVSASDAVTLKGTAPDGATVTVSDSTSLGTTTASSTGSWSFTTPNLPAGNYTFTATDTTSAGTSAASSPFGVTVGSSDAPPPAAPVISSDTVSASDAVTLKGTAPDGATVTVSDSTSLGTTTASSSGSWSFTTANLPAGSYTFTATDTTSAGTSAASSPLGVTVGSSDPPLPASGPNLVANGNFATDDFTDWTLGGNSIWQNYLPEIFITTNAEGSSTYAGAMGSMGPTSSSDGTLSQTMATTPGQTYTLSFWLQNEGSTGGNDFQAIWNGQTLLSLTNTPQSGYTEYTYTVTATSSASTLEFSALNNPSQWDLDNISLTGSGSTTATPPAAPLISSDTVSTSDAVTLKGTAPGGATVTVSDGTSLGTTTASSTGSWSFTTAALAAGSYTFTATDTTSAGTSAASSPLGVTVGSSDPPPPASGPNLVANGNFATGDFTDWTLGGNSIWQNNLPEIFITTNAEGSSGYAGAMGSMGPTSSSDGTLSQTIATTPGQTYTLSFWLQNEGSTGGNDFQAIWNGQTLLSLNNTARSGYTEYTYTVTATGSASTLEFSALNNPSQWDLDNISLTPAGSTSAPAVQSGAVNIIGTDPTVTLTGTATDGTTVSVSDGGSTPLGTTTASSSGAWSFTTPDLPAGNYAFTVTDTTPTGTTTTSKPFDVTVPTPSAGGGASGLPRIAFDPPTTLGSWSNNNQTGSTSFADIAVLGSHIASSFALPSGGQGGTMVNSELSAFGTQPLVANPHHA